MKRLLTLSALLLFSVDVFAEEEYPIELTCKLSAVKLVYFHLADELKESWFKVNDATFERPLTNPWFTDKRLKGKKNKIKSLDIYKDVITMRVYMYGEEYDRMRVKKGYEPRCKYGCGDRSILINRVTGRGNVSDTATMECFKGFIEPNALIERKF